MAKLTVAVTLSTLFSSFSILAAHDAQVIPVGLEYTIGAVSCVFS